MLGRVFTAIFWAAIFFALGAWSGGRLEPVGSAIVTGAKAIGHGAREAWNWAFYENRSASTSPNEAAAATDTAVPSYGLADFGKGKGNGNAPAGTLDTARRAFADAKVKEAIDAYKAFLALHPADPDAHGELGNVYFHNGQVGEAAKSFYSAGLFLLAEGRVSEATALVPAIRVGAPALADELQSKADRAAATPVVLPMPAASAPAHPSGDGNGQAAKY